MEENKKIKISFKIVIALIIIVVILGMLLAIWILKNKTNENIVANKKNTEMKEKTNEKIVLYRGLDFSDGKNLNDIKYNEENKKKYEIEYFNYENGEKLERSKGKLVETYEGISAVENVKKIAISVEYDAIPRKYTTIEELPEELYELADCNKVEIQSVDLDGDGKKEYIVASNSYASPEDYDTDTYTNYSDISLYDNKFKKIAILVKAKDQFREVDGKITSEFFCSLDDVEYIDIDDDGIMEVLVDLNYWESIGVNSYKYKDGKVTGETECEINPLAISESSPNHIKSEEQNITEENSNVLNKKTSKITDEMLIGDWEFKNATDKSGNEISSMEIFGSLGTNGYFTFSENERFTNNLTGGVSSEFIDEGKYTIKNDTMIELKYDDGRKGELTFSEKNGSKVLIETENNYILYLSKVLNEKTSKITDEMLIGDWEFKNATDKSGNEISSMEIFGSLGTNGYFTFSENERFTNNLTGGASSEFIDEGKYTIKNDRTIELKYDDGRKGELTFSEENGNKVLIETENNYILYLSKRTSSNNQNDLSDNSDLIGKWNTYEMIDSKTAKALEPREVFGSGYGGISYLELKEDGTFKDFISPISSSEFIDEGKYEVQRNYNRYGDCYVILNYLDGRSLKLQKVYFSNDNNPSLVISANGEGDYEYHLKK